jgi:hypothetical protein
MECWYLAARLTPPLPRASASAAATLSKRSLSRPQRRPLQREYVKMRMDMPRNLDLLLIASAKTAVHPKLAKAFRHRVGAWDIR